MQNVSNVVVNMMSSLSGFLNFYTALNHDGSFSISDRVHKEGGKKTNGPRIEPRGTPEYLISGLTQG